MATVNFVTNFSAPTNGTSSCAAAILAWRTYIVANPGDELLLPDNAAHKYAMNAKHLVCAGGDAPDALLIPTCTITATAGVTVDDFNGIGTADHIDQVHYHIASCYVGDTSVTLLNSSHASHFSATPGTSGNWLIVTGYALQHSGDPNPQRYEYKQVTGIAGAVVSFAGQPLRFAYASTWPLSTNAQADGPASISYLPANFDSTQTFNNLRVLCTNDTNFSGQPIRNLVWNNCTWDAGAGCTGASKNQTVTLTGCTAPGTGEIDKWVETIIYDSCTLGGLQIQSPCPLDLFIRNASVVGNAGGTAWNLTITDSTVGTGGGNVINSGSGYGRSNVLTITNSTVLWGRGPGAIVELVWSKFVGVGSGLFLFTPVDDGDILSFQQSVVPGFQYLPSIAGSSFEDPPKHPFCITDVYPVSSVGDWSQGIYVQTDVSGTTLPTPTIQGVVWGSHTGGNVNSYYSIPWTASTIDGVATGPFGDTVATAVCPVVTDGGVVTPPVTDILMPAGCM